MHFIISKSINQADPEQINHSININIINIATMVS